MVYNKWKKYLHNTIELCPIELAGRGKRFAVPFYSSVEDAVDDIYNSIKVELDRNEYAFWGHSMGSLLAFELEHHVKRFGHKEPVHIFFSGRTPPHFKNDNEKPIHTLPDEEFKNEIRRLGGTPKELFESKELLELFLPILRADYRIIEEYKYFPRNYSFNNSISVFSGKEDVEITPDVLMQWDRYTKNECNIYQFDGGHFFIHDNVKDITNIINSTLTKAY
jgi:medium-chain acyl-[acyl-carrier-protein] hydrolase